MCVLKLLKDLSYINNCVAHRPSPQDLGPLRAVCDSPSLHLEKWMLLCRPLNTYEMGGGDN